MEQQNDDLRALAQETQRIWERNAAFWDEYMGEGGVFQRFLTHPATERLLELQPGDRVLDIACGNGAFTRRMAALGARVVGCDFSPTFIERAKARTTLNADRIEYRVLDATDEAQLMSLGPEPYNAAVATMALMDMPTITPVLSALSRLLAPGGRFVFSVTHPCFNSSGAIKVAEEEDRDGELVVTLGVKVLRYKSLGESKGLGVVGQPLAQYYFHRTLSDLFGACFAAGFVIDGLEEPAFESGDDPDPRRAFSWSNYSEIPPALVVRCRLLCTQ